MRLSRRILFALVAAALVGTMFVVAGLDVNGSIYIPNADIIIGATIGAVIVSALLAEALRTSPQTEGTRATGPESSNRESRALS